MKQLNLIAFILLLGLFGCSSNNISSSLNTSSIYNYKTYAWTEPEIQTGDNPLYRGEFVDQSIRQSVEHELSARGFVKVDENPDLLVSYKSYTEKRLETTERGFYGAPYGYYGGFGGWGMWGSPSRTYTTTDGVLVIDLIDNKTKSTVWRGSAEGNVDDASNLTKRIQKGVKSIFKKFPDKK